MLKNVLCDYRELEFSGAFAAGQAGGVGGGLGAPGRGMPNLTAQQMTELTR